MSTFTEDDQKTLDDLIYRKAIADWTAREDARKAKFALVSKLEDLLDGWPGTLVVVSHDRYLTERVCDRVVGLFGDGRITDLPGGIEEYLRRRAGQPAAPSVASSSAPPSGDARAEGERRGRSSERAAYSGSCARRKCVSIPNARFVQETYVKGGQVVG